MTVKTGQSAQKSCDYMCQGCDGMVHLNKGDKVPECPCGCKDFDEATQTASSSSHSSQSSSHKP